MFAADCPMKRAALMTDMTLGRWSHVPAISIFSSLIVWQGAKPRTPTHRYCMVAVIWDLLGSTVLFIYFFIHLEGMDQHWKPLVRALASLRCWRYSTWLFRWVHLRGLPQSTICFGFAWLGFSSHWITTLIHFLSSVVCVCVCVLFVCLRSCVCVNAGI